MADPNKASAFFHSIETGGGGFHRKLQFWLCAAFLFLMPFFQKALPLLTLLLGLNALAGLLREPKDFRPAWGLWKQEPLFPLLAGFLLLHAIGIAHSEDGWNGLYQVQKKLGFLFFPLLFTLGPKFPEKALRWLFHIFLGGCGIAFLLGVGNALSHFIPSMSPYTLYGERFALGIHRGYLALFLMMGVTILLHLLFERRVQMTRKARKHYTVLLVLLLTGIFLTASRSALLALLATGFFFIVRFIPVARMKRVLFLGVFAVVLLGGAFLFPRNIDRMERALQVFTAEEVESPEQRALIWPVAYELFSSNWHFGVGTGDVEDELLKGYEKEGLERSFERKLNAHSQFLETGIALGTPGVLILFLILFRLLVAGWKKNSFLLFGLGLLFLFTLAFESALERQAGILFFAFFLPILARENA